ncbi:MAG: hypothetical protein ABSF45_19120 [Terriglobia bacterium]
MSLPRDIWDWVRRQFIDEVPEGDALCEFDCRKPQCTDGEWETCERRLHRAAGELMPLNKPAPETVAGPTAAGISAPVALAESTPAVNPSPGKIAEPSPADNLDPEPESPQP